VLQNAATGKLSGRLLLRGHLPVGLRSYGLLPIYDNSHHACTIGPQRAVNGVRVVGLERGYPPVFDIRCLLHVGSVRVEGAAIGSVEVVGFSQRRLWAKRLAALVKHDGLLRVGRVRSVSSTVVIRFA